MRAARAKKVETKRFYLQRSVPIQPKTSNILPKFCRAAGLRAAGRALSEDRPPAADEAAVAPRLSAARRGIAEGRGGSVKIKSQGWKIK